VTLSQVPSSARIRPHHEQIGRSPLSLATSSSAAYQFVTFSIREHSRPVPGQTSVRKSDLHLVHLRLAGGQHDAKRSIEQCVGLRTEHRRGGRTDHLVPIVAGLDVIDVPDHVVAIHHENELGEACQDSRQSGRVVLERWFRHAHPVSLCSGPLPRLFHLQERPVE
jgi:hypothetical protein